MVINRMIVEFDPSGHRLAYVSLLAERCLDHGEQVQIVTSEECVTAPTWKVFLPKKLADKLEVIVISPSFRSLSRVAQAVDPDQIVILDGDRWLISGMLTPQKRKHCWTFLLLRKPTWRSRPGIAKHLAALLLAIKGARVLHLVSGSTPRATVGSRQVGDPVHLAEVRPRDMVRRSLRLSEGIYWFAIVGFINHRKNLPLILAAFSRLAASGLGLVVAGETDPDTENLLTSDHLTIPVLRVLPPVSNQTFDEVILAADCLLVMHSNEGPSGVLARGLRQGTRILAGGAQSLRDDAKRHPNNVSWVPLEPQMLANEMRRVMEMPRPDPVAVSTAATFYADLRWNKRS